MAIWQKCEPRKWQAEALPIIVEQLRQGKRPVVSAIMGSGKSVLIAELCNLALQKLKPNAHIVVCAPRQSLVRQLSQTISWICGEENVGQFYAYRKDKDKPIVVCCNASAVGFADQKLRPRIGMLVGDEVHSTESEMFKMAFERLRPACAVGFTATPFRSNEKESLSLWDSCVYRYTAGDALKDQVIVPWELVHWDGVGDSNVNECVLRWMPLMEGPGIINAIDIKDAEDFAATLQCEGYKVKAIHSKIPRHRRESLIRRLKDGDLDALIHVSLLSEGVDMPWLRWIVLRRPVGAKVRFIQEVGRVLRCHPGKEFATIFDPHDLFTKFGLSSPEKIGELLEEEPEPDDELAEIEKDKEERKKLRELPPAIAKNQVESWLCSLHNVLVAHHIAQPINDPEIEFKAEDKITSWQFSKIERMFWASRYLPKDERTEMKKLLENKGRMNYLMAHTCISVLIGLASASDDMRKQHYHWTMPKEVRLPALPKHRLVSLLFRSTAKNHLMSSPE
jgi:superfamily II DNA or RNA helicase|tara:strand:- start:1507 stop:3027 length:1521 start_codon:yes stop_codon:yes gene_type:complete